MRKYLQYLILILVFISCKGQSSELATSKEILTKTFEGFNIKPSKVEVNSSNELDVYYGEDSRNVMNYYLLRKAAINLYDQDSLVRTYSKINFSFLTSTGEYFKMPRPFEVKLLNQEHTIGLDFKDPTYIFNLENQEESIKYIDGQAGQGGSDGGSVYYYAEAGFSINKNRSVTFYSRGAKGCNQYEKELPNGIKFDMTKEEVRVILGEHENDSRVIWEYKNKTFSILWMNDKIHFIEILSSDFAKSLREKYPLKKK